MGLFGGKKEQNSSVNNDKNVQGNVPEESLNVKSNGEQAKPKVDITTQQYQQSAIKKSLEIPQISNSDKQIIYPLIFKYGCVTQKQAAMFLSRETAQHIVFDGDLQAVTHGDETILLHTKQSLKILAELTQDNYKELQKEALFSIV